MHITSPKLPSFQGFWIILSILLLEQYSAHSICISTKSYLVIISPLSIYPFLIHPPCHFFTFLR